MMQPKRPSSMPSPLMVDPSVPAEDLRLPRIPQVDGRNFFDPMATVSPPRSPDEQDLQK